MPTKQRSIYIQASHCCGNSCATVYVFEGDHIVSFTKENDWGEDYAKWMGSPIGSPEEKIHEWKSWLAAVKKALAVAVEDGEITQEEADQALREWLKNHPNPDPAEQPIDVTEEYRKMQPIPVKVPERVERESW
jgi:hypothetical protein